MRDQRVTELVKIVKDAAAPRGARAAAVAKLKIIKKDRERQAERQLLCEYLEYARTTGDGAKIAFAESKLQQFDAESIPVAPAPDKSPAPQPDISDWLKLHERFHGPSLPSPGPLVSKADLSDPTQAFWEREGKWQDDRALAAKRIKPANPPIVVWGQDSDFW